MTNARGSQLVGLAWLVVALIAMTSGEMVLGAVSSANAFVATAMAIGFLHHENKQRRKGAR